MKSGQKSATDGAGAAENALLFSHPPNILDLRHRSPEVHSRDTPLLGLSFASPRFNSSVYFVRSGWLLPSGAVLSDETRPF